MFGLVMNNQKDLSRPRRRQVPPKCPHRRDQPSLQPSETASQRVQSSQDLQLVWNVSVRHIEVHLRTLDTKKAEPAASMLLDIVFTLVEGRLFDEVDSWVVH